VVSNKYCVLFCFSSSCIPYVVSFSWLSILIAPSVFSNVYLPVSLWLVHSRFHLSIFSNVYLSTGSRCIIIYLYTLKVNKQNEVRVTRSWVLCLKYCRSLFVLFLLVIVLSVFLQFTASDYLFGIFKLFLVHATLKAIYIWPCIYV